ncbi:hypothetical protein B0H13DRAFT_2341712 [Mycena leptocephala]|nr:hypothetical protein B0H13DRAFT_2341712 [Mycena leptocephala]
MWAVAVDTCADPVQFNMDVGITIQTRDARPPSKLMAFLGQTKILTKSVESTVFDHNLHTLCSVYRQSMNPLPRASTLAIAVISVHLACAPGHYWIIHSFPSFRGDFETIDPQLRFASLPPEVLTTSIADSKEEAEARMDRIVARRGSGIELTTADAGAVLIILQRILPRANYYL